MPGPPVPTASRAGSSAEAGLSTFLLTDIEGSTRLWEEHAAVMGAALAVHDHLLRAAIEACHGEVIKTTGDGVLAVFESAVSAIDAALAAQRALRDATWAATGPLSVRMAIHSGTAEARDGDYFGPALNRDARILAIGHGGQVLLSAVAAMLARDSLPGSIDLVDLGSHRLRDLDRPEQIYQLVVADLPSEFSPLRSLSARRSNLPIQLTSFVGRDKQVADVQAHLSRSRLVTLIGTGGTGKTRLMLEAAGRLTTRFEDGVWLAELAPLADPAGIAPEIARALGAPEVAGRAALDVVSDFLAAKELLLLLDNAEHLVDGVAAVAGHLLAVAPGLRILATSREALALPGEAVVPVPSLSCPILRAPRDVADAGSTDEAAAATEAVQLFAERAVSVFPTFELTEANIGAISEICRRLDGIPLAIELAAARVSAMSPDDIALRLGDRFRLLAGGRRTAVPRQQTLHALIDWSWDLLTEDDRRLLRRLSIFAGGWTADAAARIVGGEPGDAAKGSNLVETVDGLTRLIDRSLVVMDRGATTRYRMLETIRQYAREKLIESGEAVAIADRHFAFFAALAETAAPELRGRAMVDWLDRLDAEAENLGAGLEWGLEAAPWEAVRMCAAMLAYWGFRVASLDSEFRVLAAIDIARQRVEREADLSTTDLALAGGLLATASWIWATSGRADVAIGWAREAELCARASGDDSVLVAAMTGQVISNVFAGNRGGILELFDSILRLAEAGDWWTFALGSSFIAGTGSAGSDPKSGEAMIVKADQAARRTGNPYLIGMVSMSHGQLLGRLRRPEEARARFSEAIDRFSELGDERAVLVARSDLAHALRRGGLLAEAMDRYRETISGWVRLGNRGAIANQLEQMAFVAIDEGELPRAGRLLGAAEALREAASTPMTFAEEPEYRGFVDRLRSSMPTNDADAAWAAGRVLSETAATALAVAT